MKNVFAIILFMCYCYCFAQDCNRQTQLGMYDKILPKEVCLPNGNYEIKYIKKCFEWQDLNGDGLKDFYCLWGKISPQVGDTSYISIYFQNADSSFTQVKTLNNIYPLDHGNCMYHQISTENMPSSCKYIFERYLDLYYGYYPMASYSIDTEGITIVMPNDATYELIVKYRYDAQLKNWIYNSAYLKSKYSEIQDEDCDYSKYLGPTIDNFDYLFWDKMEKNVE